MSVSNFIKIDSGHITFLNGQLIYSTIKADKYKNVVFSNSISVIEDAEICGRLTVDDNSDFTGIVSISNEENSDSMGIGALIVKGGASIAKNVNIGNNLNVNGLTKLNKLEANSMKINGNLIVSGNISFEKDIAGLFNRKVLILNTDPLPNDNSGILLQRHVNDVMKDTTVKKGIVRSGGINNIKIEQTASKHDNHYIGWYIRFYGCDCKNEVRQIVSYDGYGRILTLNKDLEMPVFKGDQYELFSNAYCGLIFDEKVDKFILCGAVNPDTTTDFIRSTADFHARNADFDDKVIARIFTTPSDVRLKENIREIEINKVLDIIKQLRPVKFRWKDRQTEEMGLIAQEVEKVIPSIVVTNKNGMKSVAYDKLTPLLIQVVQYLIDRVEAKI